MSSGFIIISSYVFRKSTIDYVWVEKTHDYMIFVKDEIQEVWPVLSFSSEEDANAALKKIYEELCEL